MERRHGSERRGRGVDDVYTEVDNADADTGASNYELCEEPEQSRTPAQRQDVQARKCGDARWMRCDRGGMLQPETLPMCTT